MIPKIIHYCWFGKGEKPELAKKCIASWEKLLPEYKIKEWNEENFDLDKYAYTREAYDSKKYAFVTDVVRLYALFSEGGIYMDTDVEVIKPLDELLKYEAVSGFESKSRIPTGLMASKRGVPIIKELLDEYENIHFIKKGGCVDQTTNVTRITNTLVQKGAILNNSYQCVAGFTLLPQDYLCPKNYDTGEINISKNTLCIHHFSGSWHSEEDLKIEQLSAKLKWLPLNGYIATFIIIYKYHGLKAALNKFKTWLSSKIK